MLRNLAIIIFMQEIVFLDSPALTEQPMEEDEQNGSQESVFTSASSQLSQPTVPDTDSASKRPRVEE